MPRIRILSESLRNQIAAGEVVERPASVVKELVENALDAGAKHIDIEIQDGGSTKILVRDDGTGMDEQDAVMALKRYATSKITSVDDLFGLSSFGFRGEALASMGSVSELTLTTRQENSDHGIRIHSQNSGEITQVAAPVGTEIVIENLFFNVPARKKFLKSAATENSHIAAIVESFALVHHDVAFRLQFGTRSALDTPSHSGEDGSLRRIGHVMGGEFANNLFPVEYLGETLSIGGFASHPHVHRRNRKSQKIFVNQRPVSDRSIFAAISQAYESLVPRGMHPDAVLFLQIAPDLVDVNVHPRKSEVKFLRERDVFSAVKGSIQTALKRNSQETYSEKNSPQWTLASPDAVEANFTRRPASSPSAQRNPISTFHRPSARDIESAISFSKNFLGTPGKFSPGIAPSMSKSPNPVPQHGLFENMENPDITSPDTGNFENPKHTRTIIGQLRRSFILVEEHDGLRIIDQHAAHERIRYERLMKNLKEKTPESQKLLIPQVLEVSQSEQELLEAYRDVFENLGFEIRAFGDREVSLFSVPTGTEKVDFRTNLSNLLHDLHSNAPEDGDAVLSASKRIAAFASCRGAIKFGDPLTMPEMEQLVTDLFACDHPEACAHGRPVWLMISYQEMENECGR